MLVKRLRGTRGWATRKDLTDYGVLFWPVEAYLILYRAHPQEIEIVAVTQGNREIPSLLQQRS
jgi:plasmid stabilization system protein ParE